MANYIHITHGPNPACEECRATWDRDSPESMQAGIDEGRIPCEPFVGRWCDFCDDTTQRNMYDAHWLWDNDPTRVIQHGEICESCIARLES